MKISREELLKSDKEFWNYVVFNSIVPEAIKKSKKLEDIDIKFMIEGIECDFIKSMNNIDEQLDEMIQRRALKLIRDRIDDSVCSLNEILDDAKEKLIDKFDIEYE